MKNNYNKLAIGLLSLSSIIVIAEGNRWYEPMLYSVAVLVTMYSYVIAMGAAISVSAIATWSVVHSLKVANKIKQENLRIVKTMINTIDDYNLQRANRIANIVN